MELGNDIEDLNNSVDGNIHQYSKDAFDEKINKVSKTSKVTNVASLPLKSEMEDEDNKDNKKLLFNAHHNKTAPDIKYQGVWEILKKNGNKALSAKRSL